MKNRTPAPDLITEPCLTYMARIMETTDFYTFYESFRDFNKEVLDEKISNNTNKENELIEYKLLRQKPFVSQISLSRTVESFQLYLTTILRDVFVSKPQLLKSSSKIDVAMVIESGNYENLIWQIIERQVLEVSYKSIGDLTQFIEKRTGINLFESAEQLEIVTVALEVRNLIAHNDCVVNELFEQKTKKFNVPLEISDTKRLVIDDEWLTTTCNELHRTVFDFDMAISEKFDLRLLNRMSSFILRS